MGEQKYNPYKSSYPHSTTSTINYYLSNATLAGSQSAQAPQVQQPQIQQVQVQTPGEQQTLSNIGIPKYTGISADSLDTNIKSWQEQNYKEIALTNKENRLANKNYRETIIGQASPYIKAGTGIVNAASSLASIYTGLEQLKLAKKAEARADEMWREQLSELNHIRGVRKSINASYGGK